MDNLIINKNNNISSLELYNKDGFVFASFNKLNSLNIVKNIITTRIGGYSKGVFSAFNIAMNTGDNKEDVINNFKLIADYFSVDLDDFYHAYQNHTVNVKVVHNEDRGYGVTKENSIGEYDAFITNEKRLVLYVSVADCVPIFLVDPVKVAIAVIHSGWRGTLNNIVNKTIMEMKKNFGTNSSDLVACIGPSICKDCYEVSYDLYDEFRKKHNDEYINKVFIKKGNGKFNLDLWLANKLNLINSGVFEENIDITNLCTYNNPDLFFSHRRHGKKRGNMGAFLMIM